MNQMAKRKKITRNKEQKGNDLKVFVFNLRFYSYLFGSCFLKFGFFWSLILKI